ncbi:MAG: ATP-binding protein [Erysipelotrichia bacterium]|nr:ATP-binding protein [Erysipelotrichia bacterium]NCC55609.1 ATP-binding protein [Erysipelotrichia bacterium]
MNHKLTRLHIQLNSIAVFRNLLNQPILIRLQHLLLKSQEDKEDEYIDAIAALAATIYQNGGDLGKIIFTLVMEDENPYVKARAIDAYVSPSMEKALVHELHVFEAIAALDVQSLLLEHMEYDEFIPTWESTQYDFVSEYQERMQQIHKRGYGIYAKYHMFMLEDGMIKPICFPDTQRMSDFSDYERERNLVVKNTQALLSGGPASNTLLYGDAGTGKSSTIKAIVNEYKEEGLRLIEVKKQQLYQIPRVLEELSKNPLKFIIFIDDLSFVANDENFAALKSILEGSVSAIGNNVVIYATSNRRHLIKEDHQSRMGDEVHLSDTLQETMGLSSRFGLMITFNRPEKEVYLHIVLSLANQYEIDMPKEELYRKAEAFAIAHHGRSPRTAKQFIELVKAGI